MLYTYTYVVGTLPHTLILIGYCLRTNHDIRRSFPKNIVKKNYERSVGIMWHIVYEYNVILRYIKKIYKKLYIM